MVLDEEELEQLIEELEEEGKVRTIPLNEGKKELSTTGGGSHSSTPKESRKFARIILKEHSIERNSVTSCTIYSVYLNAFILCTKL